eukprot:668403-Hanusia_phi.AAC.1
MDAGFGDFSKVDFPPPPPPPPTLLSHSLLSLSPCSGPQAHRLDCHDMAGGQGEAPVDERASSS